MRIGKSFYLGLPVASGLIQSELSFSTTLVGLSHVVFKLFNLLLEVLWADWFIVLVKFVQVMSILVKLSMKRFKISRQSIEFLLNAFKFLNLVLVNSFNISNQTLLLKVKEFVSLFDLISLKTQASNLHILLESKFFETKVLASRLK